MHNKQFKKTKEKTTNIATMCTIVSTSNVHDAHGHFAYRHDGTNLFEGVQSRLKNVRLPNPPLTTALSLTQLYPASRGPVVQRGDQQRAVRARCCARERLQRQNDAITLHSRALKRRRLCVLLCLFGGGVKKWIFYRHSGILVQKTHGSRSLLCHKPKNVLPH